MPFTLAAVKCKKDVLTAEKIEKETFRLVHTLKLFDWSLYSRVVCMLVMQAEGRKLDPTQGRNIF
jgi:hypothetical protein